MTRHRSQAPLESRRRPLPCAGTRLPVVPGAESDVRVAQGADPRRHSDLPRPQRTVYGVAARMTQLIDEHEEGMRKMLDLSAVPCHAVEFFSALFRARIIAGNYGRG